MSFRTYIPFHCFVLLFVLLGMGNKVKANPIPDQLQEWVPWVKSQMQSIDCPQFDNAPICVWHGKLDISTNAKGADFSMIVTLDEKSEIEIIGNAQYWPQNIKVNEKKTPVIQRNGKAFLHLDKGVHNIQGNIQWENPPERISLPKSIAKVTIKVDGQTIVYPRLENEYLYLGEQKTEVTEADSIRGSIYRKIIDGIPLKVITRVDIQVGGRAREIDLGQVVLKDSRPTNLNTNISAQLSNDGNLKVYTGPGSYRVQFTSIFEDDQNSITIPSKKVDIYDPQEIWVWIPNENIRSVNLDGLLAIDPNMTSLASDWGGATTYQGTEKQSLTFSTTRRGIQEQSPNSLDLTRKIWLSLDGQRFRVSDILSGELNRGTRINFQKSDQMKLGRVYTDNDKLLITTDRADNVGVELRTSSINLKAESILERNKETIPIVGWDHNVQSLSAELYLPPGWTLLSSTGVDRLDGTWISTWELWDFFFILLIAMGTGKVLEWKWAALVVPTLCLTHGYYDAPSWIWVHLLFSLALLKVIQEGKFRKLIVGYRVLCLFFLVLILLPFIKKQITYGFNPQLSKEANFQQNVLRMEDYEEAPILDVQAKRAISGKRGRTAYIQEGEMISKGQMDNYNMQQQIDPNAVVQTGMGLPNWSWNTKYLTWNGPVSKEHEIELYLISPQQNTLLALLRVFLLIALSFVMIAPSYMYWQEPYKRLPDWLGKFSPKFIILFSLLSFGSIYSTPAQADNFPPKEMLEQLRTKITQESKCTAPCATFSNMSIVVEGQTILVKGEVHAAKDTGINLPGNIETIYFKDVQLNGKATDQMRRNNGYIVVRIPKGVHQISAVGILPNKNVITIPIKESHKAKYTTFKSTDWTVDGIDQGKTKNSIQLTRIENKNEGYGNTEQSPNLDTNIPPFYTVNRNLLLGLPWTVQTTVTRTDVKSGSLMRVPIIEGERIISDNVKFDNNEVLVEFPRNIGEIYYVSEIPIKDQFTLKASRSNDISEVWSVECNRVWQCDFSDLPKITENKDNKSSTWYPWPDEKLEITISKPLGVEGFSSTVDEVTYELTPGTRLLSASLTMNIRASQGGTQEVVLPKGAELQSVRINGSEKTIRPQNGVVSLPLIPGKRKFLLKWQQPWERTFHEKMPTVQIGSQAVNATSIIRLNDDRILLWTTGPEWGPVVLFWNNFAWLLIFAFVVSRFKQVPVRTYEWFLLFIGVSNGSQSVMILFVMWFAYMYWREQNNSVHNKTGLFNLNQIFAAGLTLLVIGTLLDTIHKNLVRQVNMLIQGNGSYNGLLKWYSDVIDTTIPDVAIMSIPVLPYRILMLIWSFWLVSAMLRWSKWAFEAVSKNGIWIGIDWDSMKRDINEPNTSVVKSTKADVDAKTQTESATEEKSTDSNEENQQNSKLVEESKNDDSESNGDPQDSNSDNNN